jgi:hypothetical protein
MKKNLSNLLDPTFPESAMQILARTGQSLFKETTNKNNKELAKVLKFILS